MNSATSQRKYLFKLKMKIILNNACINNLIFDANIKANNNLINKCIFNVFIFIGAVTLTELGSTKIILKVRRKLLR